MNFLTVEVVVALHDAALNPGELPGLAGNKSLEAALGRVDNHIFYAMVDDVFHIAALYAEAVARGHCFNDGNKRTAFQAMNFFLHVNGIRIAWPNTEVADRIIALARGDTDAQALADWLRLQADP